MKYILTTGCSFTNNNRFNPSNLCVSDNSTKNSWPYFLSKELGSNYTVYNLGGATNDNLSMCRVIYYWLNKLIKCGVDHSDISVIIQWSDPNRESVYIKTTISDESISMPHTLIYWDDYLKENGLFYLTGGFSPPDDSLNELGIKNAIYAWQSEVNWNNIITQTLNWLIAWNHLILYFDKWGIHHNYLSMRNIYSYEAYDNWFGAPQNNSDIPSKTIWFDKYEVLRPYISELPIDSNVHWHYKNYNGLLEWSIDNQIDGVDVFQESNGKSYSEYLKHQSNGWGHPSPHMMEKFVKEELMNVCNF
jgi:hypothetical protein